jgi:hypothetical protein
MVRHLNKTVKKNAMKNIHRDTEVGSQWKLFFKIVYGAFWVVFIIRVLTRMKDMSKSKGYQSELTNYLVVIGLGIFLVYGLFYVAYWIKPGWFKLNKEQ